MCVLSYLSKEERKEIERENQRSIILFSMLLPWASPSTDRIRPNLLPLLIAVVISNHHSEEPSRPCFRKNEVAKE